MLEKGCTVMVKGGKRSSRNAESVERRAHAAMSISYAACRFKGGQRSTRNRVLCDPGAQAHAPLGAGGIATHLTPCCICCCASQWAWNTSHKQHK
eukprot:1858415-Rhodomonas_salina.3